MVLDEFEDIQAHAARFQKDPRTLRRWMAEPDGLPHTYAGRMPLFKVSWTREWLGSKRRQNNPMPQRRGRRASRYAAA